MTIGETKNKQREQKTRLFEDAKYIVYKFTKEDKINWGRDTKIAYKLLQSYPIKFFENLELDWQCNCIAYFLSLEGKEVLKQKFEEYEKNKKLESLDFPPQVIYNLESEKIGLDKKFDKKPQNLIELLDH